MRNAIRTILFTICLLMVPSSSASIQDNKTIFLGDIGIITYDSELVTAPDGWRYANVLETLFKYVERRCVAYIGIDSLCTVERERLDIHLRIIPYEDYETLYIERVEAYLETLDLEVPEELERHEYFTRQIECIKGDCFIVYGFQFFPKLNNHYKATIVFYQLPCDKTLVHEMLHVIYPSDDEELIRKKTNGFMISREYKELLRKNY